MQFLKLKEDKYYDCTGIIENVKNLISSLTIFAQKLTLPRKRNELKPRGKNSIAEMEKRADELDAQIELEQRQLDRERKMGEVDAKPIGDNAAKNRRTSPKNIGPHSANT